MEEVIVVEVTELLEIVDVGFALGFKPFRGWLVISRDEGRRAMRGVMVVVGGRVGVKASYHCQLITDVIESGDLLAHLME